MYRVTAWFKDHKISQKFYDLYDAIEFKDSADAHYADKVIFEKGVFSLKKIIYDNWNMIMDNRYNPLRHIPDINTRHMVMQVLAWMWCITFSAYFSSMWIFGLTAIAHTVILAAIAITVGTFAAAKHNPQLFRLRNDGYHSVSRTRGTMWINGQRVVLDANDPGGEHE